MPQNQPKLLSYEYSVVNAQLHSPTLKGLSAVSEV